MHGGMAGRLSLFGITCISGLALGSCGHQPVVSKSTLPIVEIAFRDLPTAALFARPSAGKDKRWVKVRYLDIDGEERSGKVALRGFSAWHHGRTKPSMRLKPKGKRHGGPDSIELSRPEDPLAICNWLPDQLGAGLGLMHEHSQPVRVLLNGRDCGVYLRSVRPGDDLCDAEGRPRGTFFKGDSLGSRRHFDLWQSSASWRPIGSADPDATTVLNELLAVLQQPPTPESFFRLHAALDLELAARALAVASLVGSIHADAVHNHVLFYNAKSRRLEPLLWDANGFGVHAEPELAVDIARHPIAARLLCHPEFLHRRNEVLWDLLQGRGSAPSLVAAVDQRLKELDEALKTDPEIARLVLRRGVFELDVLGYAGLPAARAAFVEFVERRHMYLCKWFEQARVSMSPTTGNPQQTLVTVSGSVAVRLSRRDGAPIRSAEGRDASVLWPGISQDLIDERQLQQADGRGVSAPHGNPAPLQYVVACPLEQLRVHNAFTGKQVAAVPAPTAAKTRSLHPWTQAAATPATPR